MDTKNGFTFISFHAFVKALHLVKKSDCKRTAFVNLKYALKDIFNRASLPLKGLSFLWITSLLTSLNKR